MKPRYIVHTFDLSIARDNAYFPCGEMNAVLVREIQNVNANVKLKFDSTSNQNFPLHVGDTLNWKNLSGSPGDDGFHFSGVYITNDAVASGTCTLIFAYNIEIQKLLRITSDVAQQGIRNAAVTVTDTATLVPPTPLTDRIGLVIVNASGSTVYVGDSGVTAAVGRKQGIPIQNGESMSFSVIETVDLYAIVTPLVGSAVINIMEYA